MLARYLIIGAYVGFATVGIFIYWYCYDDFGDGHSLISYNQLSNWSECPDWKDFQVKNYGGFDFSKDPWTYFTIGKVKACTLSLSTLVMIEMLNSLNAISEDGSLLHMPPWVNLYLLVAIAGSVSVHMVIIYVPFFAEIFGTARMTFYDWIMVLAFSAPVILIDEILKIISRFKNSLELKKRLNKHD